MTAHTPPTTSIGDAENPGGLRHTPALDGIRGIAIILILIDHLLGSNSSTGSRLFDILAAIRQSTWVGVNIFFVLSGFLITGILWDTLHKPNFFRNFYARRALRIFPLYYTFLFVLMALTHVLHLQWNGAQPYLLTYTLNLAYWHRTPMNLGFVNINHFWSLQVEEQFYLVWPIVVYRVRKLRPLIWIAATVALIPLTCRFFAVLAPTALPPIFMTPTLHRADDLLSGCILALVMRIPAARRWFTAHALKFVAAVCVILLALAIHARGFTVYSGLIIPTLGLELLDLGTCSVIALALINGSRTSNLLQNWTLRQFGRYSYGLYVYHYSINGLLTPRLRAFMNLHFHSKALAVVVSGIIVALASIAVAVASYHLYEVHFLRFKRFFSYTTTRSRNSANAN